MKSPFCLLFFLLINALFSQGKSGSNTFLDVNYFLGNIALHNNDILHLIKGHPDGFIFSFNQKTFGEKDWQRRFNYPDYGASFVAQSLKNDVLGNTYGLYAHYNFYFLKRNIMLRVGQGLALTTNPYDKIENPKNIAFGSHILSSTFLMLNYKKERLFDRFGVMAGATLVHYSNANVKAPNTSVNTVSLNAGLTYSFNAEDVQYIEKEVTQKFSERIKYNVALRSGINQSDIIGSAQFPFYIVSAYADKKLSQLSAIQLGADVFFSNFLKELIYYKSVSFPEEKISGDEDYKRVGVFVGHELFVGKISLETQLGYYLYYPFDFEGRTYVRVGLKRYFGHKFFGAVTLKSHGAKAEAVEFGVGLRF